ncbi:MAG: YHS domain-containing protein [Candidatus Rokubacteria bacterium]|nr:YHS domain-containing protein [Candidatus Rokubacteria bacterium]
MTTARETDAVFLMADLSGFTALTEAHGSLHAADVVARYMEIVRGALEDGVRFVERVGDGILLVADEAAPAVRTAIRLREAIEREPLFPMVRIGLNAGRVVERGGEFFGSPLNLTARVTAHARAGQILCTEPVAASTRALGDVELCKLGTVKFKNVSAPVPVFELVCRPDAAAPVIDPVCRMRVDPETAAARILYKDAPRYFCSLECAKAFLEKPDGHSL